MSVDRHQMRWGIAIAVVIGVFVFGMWVPGRYRVKSARADIQQAEEQLGIARGSAAALAELAREVDQLRREAEMQNKVVPDRSSLASLLRQLSMQIDSAGLTGEGVSTGKATITAESISMPIELSLVGRSVQVFELVRRIERLPSMLHVEELVLENDPDEPGRVEASLTIRAFFSPEESGGAS